MELLHKANEAIDILLEFPDDLEHIFVYNNATIHKKRPDDSLSARHMPKNVPKKGTNWLVETTKRDEAGNLVYKSDGSLEKEKICMGDAAFRDGTP